MKKIILILILTFSLIQISNAQFLKNISVGVGISTTQILGSNPAGKSIFPSTDADPIVIGGGFYGAQPGLDFRLTIPIDSKSRWRIPVGIDYQYFIAKEYVPEGKYVEARLSHTLDVMTPYLGISYVLQDLRYLRAKTYLSFEMRTAIISNIDYRMSRIYYNLKEYDTTFVFPHKSSAIRVGGILKAGVEGYVVDPIQINATVGLSLMNLINRDDKRGNLLTPNKFMELKESYLWNLNFSILLQYTF